MYRSNGEIPLPYFSEGVFPSTEYAVAPRSTDIKIKHKKIYRDHLWKTTVEQCLADQKSDPLNLLQNDFKIYPLMELSPN